MNNEKLKLKRLQSGIWMKERNDLNCTGITSKGEKLLDTRGRLDERKYSECALLRQGFQSPLESLPTTNISFSSLRTCLILLPIAHQPLYHRPLYPLHLCWHRSNYKILAVFLNRRRFRKTYRYCNHRFTMTDVFNYPV